MSELIGALCAWESEIFHTTDPIKQMIFANSVWENVRLLVAYNPYLNIDSQFALAKDKNRGVRWHLAGNESIADEVQLLLAHEFPYRYRKNYGPKTKAYLEMTSVLNK